MSRPQDSPAQDIDYIFGTYDEEIERLGLQHRVWRPRASDAWRRAGFTVGQTVIDVGSGPGYASIDLAEIVGKTGHIVALERSARFISALRAMAANRGIENIAAHQLDLVTDRLPPVLADGAWVRWVFAFLTNPRNLVERLAKALKPGGALVIHEYFDYRTWRFLDEAPMHREFVEAVMRTWRAEGGEPDIARSLPEWIEATGMRIESMRTIVDVISPKDYAWQWPASFLDIGIRRLLSLGALTPAQSEGIRAEFAVFESRPHARMVTPGVLEIVARK